VLYRAASSIALSLLLLGCATTKHSPLPTVAQVDLKRFMGPWYVLASIPTFLEKDAYGAVESYALNDDGTVAVDFTFRKGGFDGPRKSMHPKGFVLDSSNAVWGMRFIWPIKAEYRICYLESDYSAVIIGRTARDYVWIMARTPEVPAAEYAALVKRVAAMGYDVGKLRKVPQQ
jgi:apolipoprotein D and lipocalin family protein